MNDQAFLKTPGEMLSKARRDAGLSLAVLAERTKIPVPMLEAIEGDEYHRISDPLYVKSFLRAAATEVGLDQDEILELYSRMVGGSRALDPAEEVWEKQKVTIRRVGLPWRRILVWGALVLVAVAVVVFIVSTLGGGESSPVTETRTPPQTTAAEPVVHRESVAAEPAAAGDDEVESSLPDTLAGGWLAEPPRDDPPPPRQETRQEAEPVEAKPEPEVADEAVVAEPRPAPVQTTPAPEESPSPPETPASPEATSGSRVELLAGQPDNRVLRILTTVPVTASVRRDGERSFTRFRLPGVSDGLPPLPAAGITPGRPYAAAEGVVAYWGARDHFDLALDRVDGVEVSFDGGVRDLSRVKPGDVIVLDAFGASSGR